MLQLTGPALLLLIGVLVGCDRAPLPHAPTPVAAAGLEAAGVQSRFLAAGEQFVAAFFAGQVDAVWATLDPGMKDAIGSVDALREIRDDLENDLGTPMAAGASYVAEARGTFIYTRAYAFTQSPERQNFVVAFRPDGKVSGFTLKALAAEAKSPFTEYQTKAVLRLPFEGQWAVAWGGRTVDANYHSAYQGQRFAYDMGIVKNGRTHRGDGSRNEQYYAFDMPLVAPAVGRVVAAVDGLPDNPPGKMDPEHPGGNHVLLDLGNGEFAFLAHLKQGSVKVRVGDTVTPGQALGRCGNSGNTSEPHLHFHLQNKPTLDFAPDEYGLPAQFQNYTADGQHVARGEPTRGQLIAPGR